MKENKITSKLALNKYGISSRHSRMPNDELRFRLIKEDGTAYIRTESSVQGGWQNSHYHTAIHETYIVQKGWIGYAELLDGTPKFTIYKEGENFTTEPYVIHNIYMPAQSIIHTVKHGDATSEERTEDEEFTKLTKSIKESDLLDVCSAQSCLAIVEKYKALGDYSEAYRHFDNFIWQVTAWSSGIFAVIIGGTSQLSGSNPIVVMTEIPFSVLIISMYLFFSLFIFVLSYALYRFRWHQIIVKNYSTKKHLKSPQVWLQLIVNAQAFILLMLSLLLIKFSIAFSIALVFILLFSITLLMEIYLTKHGKNQGVGKKASNTRS